MDQGHFSELLGLQITNLKFRDFPDSVGILPLVWERCKVPGGSETRENANYAAYKVSAEWYQVQQL